MKHGPLVTIAIPTYNRAEGFLSGAIESAINQTYSNTQVIVSDNCSTDNTEELVKAFKKKSIEYYRHTVNIGPQNNFNFCIEKARGDYFLLLHDDDSIDDDFVESCLRAAAYETNKGIIRTGTRIIDENGNVVNEYYNRAVGLTTFEFFQCWFEGKTAFYLCSTLFNTKKLKEIGGFSSKNQLFNDVFAEVKLAAMFGRADVPEIKASFRKHSGEITFSSKISSWCEDSLLLIDLMCDLVPEHSTWLKKEGARFLAKLNYHTADGAKNPLKRLYSNMIVYKSYNFRYPPPYLSRKLEYFKKLIK